MKKTIQLSCAFATLAITTLPVHADIKVVTSIKPVQGLVAAVMGQVATPLVIVDNAASPHTFALKPSHATALQNADIVFWVGHELEIFLEKPLESLSGTAKVIALIDAPKMITWEVREEHKDGAESHDHDHEGHDGHIWLDPENAKTILQIITETLSAADPTNAKIYEVNRATETMRIEQMQMEISTTLSTVKTKRFVVFHDAYQYFEKHFGLRQPAVISIQPENAPGAEKLKALRQELLDGKADCVFAEPQFDSKLVQLITEGTTVKTAVLDPLGATTSSGPDFYRTMMLSIATALKKCLG